MASKVTVKGIKGKPQVFHAVYDFAIDGGAQGAIGLFDLSANTLIHDAWFEVETAVTSAGAPTLDVGVTADADGVFAQALKAVYAIDVVSSDVMKGAYLFDTTEDCNLRKKFTSATTVNLTIGTADLTAGKVHFYLVCSDGY